MKQPTAYIRRSVARRADPGDISREYQVAEVRRLAGDPALVIIDRDWGKSAATDKTDRRLAFLALLDSIEAGEVSALYAYSTDRLARSVEWSARLLNACRRASVPIVTREGRIEPGDASAALLFHVLASVNENALSGMEAKARATVERRRERNREAGRADNAGMGCKPYGTMPGESTEAVIRAFGEAGSFNGAAKLLSERGVRSRLSGRPNPRENGGTYGWSCRSVSRIVRRERPDLLPAHPRQGARTRSTRTFAGLLTCHCGTTLTSMPRATSVGYYCRTAHANPTHPRPYVVSERRLLGWAQEEAARLRPVDEHGEPFNAVAIGEENESERAELGAKHERIVDMYADGTIGKPERDRRLAAVTTALESIDARSQVAAVPVIDWDGEPAALNLVLRALWHRIELGPDLLPVRAEWAVPDWRA